MDNIAVVILNWNGVELLKKFLPNIVKYSNLPNTKVYVADNASTDESVKYIKQNFAEVGIVINDKNYGFAEGYNKALKFIDAKYYAIINSDIDVTEGWLNGLLETIESSSNIAVVQPKIRAYKNPEYFEYAGAAGGLIDKYGFTFCRGRLFNVFEIDENQYNENADIFWASGACFFIKADLFHNVGGFDADFFAHMEEIDLCWRLKNRGYRIVYTPNSTIFHIGGATLEESNPFKTYLNFRNNLFLLYKNLPQNKLHKILIARLLLDGIAGIKFLISLELKNFKAVLKAHYYFYTNLKIFKPKREKNIANNTNYKHNEIYNKSIVYDFFIKKIKKYSELKF